MAFVTKSPATIGIMAFISSDDVSIRRSSYRMIVSLELFRCYVEVYRDEIKRSKVSRFLYYLAIALIF